MMGTLKKEQEEFEKGLTRAEEQVKVARTMGAAEQAAAQRLTRLGHFLQKLSILADSKRHLALMEMKRRTDLLYTQTTASAVKEMLVASSVIEHNLHAQRHIRLRKSRMAFALEKPLKRLKKEALLTIEARGHAIQKIKSMRQDGFASLLMARAAQEKQIMTVAVSKWRTLTSLEQRRAEAMRGLFLSRRRWDLHSVLRRWNAACIVRNQKDVRACKVLESMVSSHQQRQLR